MGLGGSNYESPVFGSANASSRCNKEAATSYDLHSRSFSTFPEVPFPVERALPSPFLTSPTNFASLKTWPQQWGRIFCAEDVKMLCGDSRLILP
jgi:hypothetical protein